MLTVEARTLSGGGLEYREFLPGPALASDVEYLWTMRASRPLAAPLAQTSASKSSLDLIVALEGRFCASAEQHLFGDSGGAYLVGAISTPRTIVTAGRCVAAGVRFRPGRAHALFRVPMRELTDRVLALASVDPRLERRLTDRAHAATVEELQVRAMEHVLCELAARSRLAEPRDGVSAALRLIERHHGNVRVGAIAHAAGTSVRQLERRFREVVGLGPKLASRIARVRHAMALLPLRSGATWSDVAFSCGFYDQAHLIREFRAIAGVTPTRFTAGCTAAPPDRSAAA